MHPVEITKSLEEATCITHAGTFHADEVFATVILSKVLEKVIVIRVPEIEEADGKIVYDIGGGEFDHHQKGGNGKRKNRVSYSSCGLIWKRYGEEVIKKYTNENVEEIVRLVDEKLITFIDANDNGELPKIDTPYSYVDLANIISSFNPHWEEKIDSDIKFLEAVKLADQIFENMIQGIISKRKAKVLVEEKIKTVENGILILEKFIPWKEHLLLSENPKKEEVDFVVHPSNRGGYSIHAVPKELDSFESKVLFPESWAGKRGKELQKVTGIFSAIFCHNKRFIAGAETKEDAIKLATLAIREHLANEKRKNEM